MSFSNLYTSRFKTRNRDHFAAIVRLALADGKISDEEQAFINRTAINLEIDEAEVDNIIENIKGPSTFEIVARIDGPKGRGKYAMTHAIAICTFPNAFFNKIRQTNTFIGWPWNRIKLRWKTIDGILNLQMKTRTHYGVDANNAYFKIKYHVTNLWNDKHMNGLLDK